MSLLDNLRREVLHGPFANNKTRHRGKFISQLTCPACGKPEAYAHYSEPWVIICNRKNKCGAKTKTLPLFMGGLR